MHRLRSAILTQLSVALLLFGLVASPATARADRKSEGNQAAQRADRAFAKGDHATALAEYQASYAKYPKPFLLFRIGECQRLLGKDADALATFKRYLAKVAKGADRKRAQAYVAELGPKVAAATQPPPQAEPAPRPVAQTANLVPEPSPAAPVAVSHTDERKPVYKKWWLWTIVGGVVVVGVGLGVGLGLGLNRFDSELPVGGPAASALSVRF